MLKTLPISLKTFPTSASVPRLTTIRNLAVILLISDLLSLFGFLQLIHEVRLGQVLDVFSLAFLTTVILMVLGLYTVDAYRPDIQIAGLKAPARTLIGCCLVAIVLATLNYLFTATMLSPLMWRSVLLPGLSLFTMWAVLMRSTVSAWARAYAKQSACLLLGTDTTIRQFERDFMAWNPLGKLVALTNTSDLSSDVPTQSDSIAGSLNDLSSWISNPWSGVIVTPDLELPNQQMHHLMHLRFKGTPIYNLTYFYEVLLQKIPPALLQEDTSFAFAEGFHLVENRINLKIKRLIDIFTTVVLLVVASPIMLLAALIIKLESPGPIFYSQYRNGLHHKPFRVYKFRSMRQDAEKQGAQWAQTRDPRVTRVGYWLRLMRIDELPQLWNVLKGEMSLIGPRPERPEFDTTLAAQIPHYNLRYLIKPGITGWAQVMYPYGASVEDAYEKVSYDLYYIKNYSLWLDLAIIFKTVRIVFLGKGR